MKLGILGLPQSGKATILSAITGARSDQEGVSRGDQKIATITVHDDRIDYLSEMYQPKKTSYAKIEYLFPSKAHSSKSESGTLNEVRMCDGCLHVVRNFTGMDGTAPDSEKDFWTLENDMILSDLMVVEKRIERIEADIKRGKKNEGVEHPLLLSCREILEKGLPLRDKPELANDPLLRGYTLLSAKPMLVIINNDDDDEKPPLWNKMPQGFEMMAVRGRLEMDLTAMSPEEAEEFIIAYNIKESVLDRIIKSSYRLLNRISFFTVGPDEVRAWPVCDGIEALDAAEVIHSDIKKGFIRAEVLAYEDLRNSGTYQDARKSGLVRLEGKKYVIKDGDIINFRFNV